MSTSISDRTYHHGDLRAALVAAALDLLETAGEAALSLRAAARACGVSAMAPYRHFADKEDLLEAVAAPAVTRELRAKLPPPRAVVLAEA